MTTKKELITYIETNFKWYAKPKKSEMKKRSVDELFELVRKAKELGLINEVQ